MSDEGRDTDRERAERRDLPVPLEVNGDGTESDESPERRWSVPLSARQANIVSILVLLIGLALLAGPVLGDGPDPDRVYTYDAVTVDPETGSAVGVLVGLPEVAYVAGETAEVVVDAANETYTRSTAEPGTGRLVETFEDVEFVRESGRRNFYRVDARVDGRTFRLDTERVTPRVVVESVAVPAEEAPPRVVTAARAGGAETTRPFTPALVALENRYVAVVRTDVSERPDPRALEKQLAMVFGLVLTFVGAVGYTRVGT